MTIRKKNSDMKPKDVGSSSKSLKGKQVCFKFDFIEVVKDDTVMIYLIYFLECDLLDKLKNLCVCRESLP